MDYFLLGLGAELGAFCRQLYCSYLPGAYDPGVCHGCDDRTGGAEYALVFNFWRAAIHFELFANAGIADAVAQEVPAGLYVLLDQLLWGQYASIAAILLVCMFVITSADSATFVLGMFTSKGVLNPTRFVRILWGGLQLLMAAALLLSGGLLGLRTVSIVTAFPFMLLMVLMAYSLYLDLYREWLRREERSRILNQRIERMLLRESEREAVRQEG